MVKIADAHLIELGNLKSDSQFNNYRAYFCDGYQAALASRAEPKEVEELVEACEKFLARIAFNQSQGYMSGIGEYRGGPAFVVSDLRLAIAHYKRARGGRE